MVSPRANPEVCTGRCENLETIRFSSQEYSSRKEASSRNSTPSRSTRFGNVSRYLQDTTESSTRQWGQATPSTHATGDSPFSPVPRLHQTEPIAVEPIATSVSPPTSTQRLNFDISSIVRTGLGSALEQARSEIVAQETDTSIGVSSAVREGLGNALGQARTEMAQEAEERYVPSSRRANRFPWPSSEE